MKISKIIKSVLSALVLAALLVPTARRIEALDTAGDEILISSVEELAKLRQNPTGHFRLTKDLDLGGKAWIPLDFCGYLDGDGHSLLNVKIVSTGSKSATTYDGNMKEYETVFAGFFASLENAEITNLNIVNLRATVDSDKPCFLGGIAGYMDKSVITGCSVTGELKLTANAPMFGLGGFVGFGNGEIKESTNDMTLICIDKNAEERDEQFLGGGYGAGYVSINNCKIKVHGFDSDHGYVHNGGITGMFGLYPKGFMTDTYITNTHVVGKITFFEDNTDRRAYCEPYCGEVLNWTYEWGGCTENFEKDERFEYDKVLLPEMCENPEYTCAITAETDDSYGFTTYTCKSCGYSYTDNYVLHTADLKALEEASTTAAETTADETSVTEPVETDSSTKASLTKDKDIRILIIILASVLSFAVIMLIILYFIKHSRKGDNTIQ